jgi:hypothetical protein
MKDLIRKKYTGEAGLIKLYLNYKKSARREHREFNLTIEEFKEITSNNCTYCGIEPLAISAIKRSKKFEVIAYTLYKYNGIDRIDSSEGYVQGNVAPCCKWCNRIKRERTVKDFKEHIDRIYKHLNEI